MPVREGGGDQRGTGILWHELRKVEKAFLYFEFNIDTACVEQKYSDGSMLSINTTAVENEVADNIYQRSELEWLIYNKPLEYAKLVLGGDFEGHLKEKPEHRMTD